MKKWMKQWWTVVIWAGVAEGVGLMSQLFCPDVKGYYLSVRLPPLAPAPWVFGVAWGVLYLLMGGSAGWIYQLVSPDAARQQDRRLSQVLYVIQLALNFAWSLIFFRWQAHGWALVTVVALVVINLYQLWLYYRLDKRAALALLPYVAWLVFATYLTAGVVYLA